MGFMAVALVVAVLVVVATRGSLRQLAQLPVEGFGMLFVALGIQAALSVVHVPRSRVEDVGFGLLILSYACILGFCFANLRLRGMAIITIGIAMNALVIALNQGMPANGPTRVDARGNTVSTVATSVKHRPERPGDVLTVLDDRIMLPRPFHEILSFGDLILAFGLVDVCYWGSRREERERLSVFALDTVPGPPPPPPRPTTVVAPAPAATPATVTTVAADEVEPVERVDEIDLTAPALASDADDADDTDTREPAEDPYASDPENTAWLEPPAEPAPSDPPPSLLVSHPAPAPRPPRVDTSLLDDEAEAALWLAAP